MGTLTVRNIDDRLKKKLRERAARRGMSMESSVRAVLQAARSVPTAITRSWRLKASLEDLLALSNKPEKSVDLKALSDRMWDEGLR